MILLRSILTSLILLLLSLRALCIESYIQTSVFYLLDGSAYVDISLFIHDNDLKRNYNSDSLFSVQAQVTYVLRSEQSIIKAEKLSLKSPFSQINKPILHNSHWALPPGKYSLETTIIDEWHLENELTLINEIEVFAQPGHPCLSDIYLSSFATAADSTSNQFVKNGWYMEPLLYQTFEENQNILNAYFESYLLTGDNAKYFYRFTLNRLSEDDKKIQIQEWFRLRKAGPVDPFFLKHDISELVSGKYSLNIQLLDHSKKPLNEKTVVFYRKNPFWDVLDTQASLKRTDKLFFDTLNIERVNYAVRAVLPLLSATESPVVSKLLDEKRDLEKRRFLFSYFSHQDDSAVVIFHKYMSLARYLDVVFKSGFGYGFETDRGRIFLRYGRPDEIISEDKDPGAYPYEIWKYSRIENPSQSNVKFLFYNPDLAESDFRLLHSTAIGERQNTRWEIELYQNAKTEISGNNFFDATRMNEGFNRRAREYFDH